MAANISCSPTVKPSSAAVGARALNAIGLPAYWKVRERKDWSVDKRGLQLLKGGLAFVRPMENTILLSQGYQGSGDFSIAHYEFSEVICQPKELMDLCHRLGHRPVLHSGNLFRVNFDTVSGHHVA